MGNESILTPTLQTKPEMLLGQRIIKPNVSGGSLPVVAVNNEKRTYSVDEIQQILDISRSTAYLLIRRKVFKSVKVGKQIRVSKKSFDEWLDTT